MAEQNRAPSSLSSGFFQTLPSLPPQYTSSRESNSTDGYGSLNPGDPVLPRILKLYLPSPFPAEIDTSLHSFARICLDKETLRLMVSCETDQPTLHLLNTFGEVNKVTPLRTSEGWRQLKRIQTQAGIVGLGYTSKPHNNSTASQGPSNLTWNRRLHQFSTAHLWAGSAALVTCPAAMTDGAAVLLGRHLQDPDGDQPGRAHVLNEARNRLISFDPSYAWTSGQWMTERTGGSDVSETETLARRLSTQEIAEDNKYHGSDEDAIGMALGPWRIDGFKWFSSATDADMSVLLARTTKGISAFYAPLRRMSKGFSQTNETGQLQSCLNGVHISRLKNKLGTKGLPTAELEIRGMRAWLIGEEGKGVKEIGAILNSTRLWTANGAIGYWSRGLAISRAYAKVRRVKGGKQLCENRQHVRWMADETVKYRAFAHLVFLGVALMGVAEQGYAVVINTKSQGFMPRSATEAELLLRVLTPLMKAQCSLAAINGLRECMESLGGVGYCENNEDGGVMNIARLFRDANVNAIWEGTTSILAEDLIRVIKGKAGQQSISALEALIGRLLQPTTQFTKSSIDAVRSKWHSFKEMTSDHETDAILCRGREVLECLQDILCAGLLLNDAQVDGDEIALTVADRWINLRFGHASESGKVKAPPFLIDQIVYLGRQSKSGPNMKSRI